MRYPFIAPLAAFIVVSVLASCNSAGPPPAPSPQNAPTGVTPNTFSMPTGGGCAGEVARFQAVRDTDIATGHTTTSVYDRITTEIATARNTCAAGNEAGAIGQLNGTKARFGYR